MTYRLLITGAAGNMGTLLRPRLARHGRILRLLDIAPLADPMPAEEFHTGDVTCLEDLTTAAPRPDTYYGVSKAAMESLGSLYADRFGMDVVAVRIGMCFARPPDARGLATWLSPDDAARLVEACLAAPPFGFRLIWGISANTRRWWSLREAAELGYRPVDDAEVFADCFPQPDLDADEHRLLGGVFCAYPLGARW